MRAIQFQGVEAALQEVGLPDPEPGAGQVRLRVQACGVCRTDLHIVDGELAEPRLPLILGHQIVGIVDAVGAGVSRFGLGDRVGVPWLGGSCGNCRHCEAGHENLCDEAQYTGYQLPGGFAQAAVADARFAFSLPSNLPELELAPLLCAGLIGFRALGFAQDARRIGFFGFGASAHILVQIANQQGREVYAFTRPGDDSAKQFATRLGAVWAGDSNAEAPVELDAAILFAPVGELVPTALRAVRKGGVVICAGIHMSDIPSFPYEILWGERVLRSVANLTRRDGELFFRTLESHSVHTEVSAYSLRDTGRALDDLRAGRINGAAVIDLTREA